MITKFETYNEGRFFKDDNDDVVKKLIAEIKSTFDVRDLKRDSNDDSYEHYKYDNVKVEGRVNDLGLGANYELYVDYKEIENVSKYLVKGLWKFFEKEYKNRKKEINKVEDLRLNKNKDNSKIPSVTYKKDPKELIPKIERPKINLGGLKKFLD